MAVGSNNELQKIRELLKKVRLKGGDKMLWYPVEMTKSLR